MGWIATFLLKIVNAITYQRESNDNVYILFKAPEHWYI